MKNIQRSITFLLILFIFTQTTIQAATVTPTKSPVASPSAGLDAIEKIKEMVASKVAELKLVEKKGILGTVKDSSNTQITLEDTKGIRRIIDIDELTKFQDSSSKTFGISDIAKGDILSCIGLYNKDSKRLLARYVSKAPSFPIQIEGIVVDKIKSDFIVKVATDTNPYLVEFETNTKTQSFQKDEGLKKTGYSKINTNQRIFVSGYIDSKDKNKILADRVIHFIDLPGADSMKKNQQQAMDLQQSTETPVPTKK